MSELTKIHYIIEQRLLRDGWRKVGRSNGPTLEWAVEAKEINQIEQPNGTFRIVRVTTTETREVVSE